MRDVEVPNKTDAGRDEIQNRTLKLPNGLRSILLMVDGQRNVAQLRGVMSGLKSPDDALQQLEALGLIAVPQSLAAAAAATIRDSARPALPTSPASERNVPAYSAQPDSAPSAPATSSAASGYSALYTLMSETVREHLGLRGYFLQLKVERCADVGELMALLPEFSTALAKARDSAFAQEMEHRFRTLERA